LLLSSFLGIRYGRPVPVHPLLGFDPNRIEGNASFSSTLDPPVIEGGRIDAVPINLKRNA
jgi:hypothetical protein